MRLLPGGDLCRRIASGKLTIAETLRILRELSRAFAHAHARNVVHRDVKPANVLFDDEDYPVLTDFGIAKALDAGADLTKQGHAIGTALYMSPEQACGDPVDARTDLYGLGVVLFEMLTGRPPYDGDSSREILYKHIGQPVPRLPAPFAGLQPLISTLMAKDRDDRPRDADALIALIDQVSLKDIGSIDLASVRAEPRPPVRQPPPQAAETVLSDGDPTRITPRPDAPGKIRSVRRAAVMVGSVLIAVAAAGGGWWWLQQDEAAKGSIVQAEPIPKQPPSAGPPESTSIPVDGAESALPSAAQTDVSTLAPVGKPTQNPSTESGAIINRNEAIPKQQFKRPSSKSAPAQEPTVADPETQSPAAEDVAAPGALPAPVADPTDGRAISNPEAVGRSTEPAPAVPIEPPQTTPPVAADVATGNEGVKPPVAEVKELKKPSAEVETKDDDDGFMDLLRSGGG
ncbi:MAG: protein kinase domain-containing protein [Panacagrimonas sp.]